jgi:pimeloyl-ACP methyl ester carboxylesterase
MENFEYNLGLLFVHGIGDRAQGSTLIEFAKPLCEWIKQEAGPFRGDVEFVDANLCPGGDTPGHAAATMTVDGVQSKWLLAEAWWAQSFRPPRFRDVARWGFEVIPWTLSSHFAVRLQRALQTTSQGESTIQRLKRDGRILYALLSMMAGLVASLIGVLVVAVMLIIVLIPIRRVREAIGSLQRTISSTLGDSFVLIENPINEAAIVSQVRRNIRWLRDKGCKKIAVVAHSQGGAVAVRALQDEHIQADRLITFGSGLRKLEELAHLRRERHYGVPATIALVGVIFVGVALLAFVGGLTDLLPGRSGQASVLAGAIVSVMGALAVSWGLGGLLTTEVPGTLRKFQQVFRRRVVEGNSKEEDQFAWLDLYSSHDPVSNGALFSTDQDPPAAGGHEISNLRSITLDHNSYWKNLDEFVPRVGSELVKVDTTTQQLAITDAELDIRHANRNARNKLRQGQVFVTAASSASVFFAYLPEWRDVARRATAPAVGQIRGLIGLSASSDQAALPTDEWPAAILWLSAIVVLGLLGRAAWQRWNLKVMSSVHLQLSAVQRRKPKLIYLLVYLQMILAFVAVHGSEVTLELIRFVLVVGATLGIVILSVDRLRDDAAPAAAAAQGAGAEGDTRPSASQTSPPDTSIATMRQNLAIENQAKSLLLLAGGLALTAISIFVYWTYHAVLLVWPHAEGRPLIHLLLASLYLIVLGSAAAAPAAWQVRDARPKPTT